MSNEEQKKRAEQGSQASGERHDPAGFTPRSGGLTSEYAREQGWDINEEERTKRPAEKQEYDGGRDYDYGAQDFGDTAVDTSSADPEKFGIDPERVKNDAREAAGEDQSANVSQQGSRNAQGGGFTGPESEDI